MRFSVSCRCFETRSSPSVPCTSFRVKVSTLLRREKGGAARANLSFERKANDGLDTLLEQADGDESEKRCSKRSKRSASSSCTSTAADEPSRRVSRPIRPRPAMGQGLHKLSHKTSPAEPSRREAASPTPPAGHPLTAMGVDPNDIFGCANVVGGRSGLESGAVGCLQHGPHPTPFVPMIRASRARCRSHPIPMYGRPTSALLQALLLVQDRVLASRSTVNLRTGDAGYEPPRRDALLSPPSSVGSPFAFGRLGVSRSALVSSDETPATFPPCRPGLHARYPQTACSRSTASCRIRIRNHENHRGARLAVAVRSAFDG